MCKIEEENYRRRYRQCVRRESVCVYVSEGQCKRRMLSKIAFECVAVCCMRVGDNRHICFSMELTGSLGTNIDNCVFFFSSFEHHVTNEAKSDEKWRKKTTKWKWFLFDRMDLSNLHVKHANMMTTKRRTHISKKEAFNLNCKIFIFSRFFSVFSLLFFGFTRWLITTTST